VVALRHGFVEDLVTAMIAEVFLTLFLLEIPCKMVDTAEN